MRIRKVVLYKHGVGFFERSGKMRPVWVEPFSEKRLAWRCIVSQPATLIRRAAWEAVGGLDESLHMALDYDLWWKLYRKFGPLQFVLASILWIFLLGWIIHIWSIIDAALWRGPS